MAIDSSSPKSRRAILSGALGAAAATLVGAVTRPLPAEASTDHAAYLNNETGANVLVAQSLHQSGYPNSGTGTAISATTASGTALNAKTGYGFAVQAHSGASYGVYASSASSRAIDATSTSGDTAVAARNDSGTAVWGESNQSDGVFGQSHDAGHSGVFATNDAGGWGVFGWAVGPGTPRKPAKPAVVGFNEGFGTGVLGYSGSVGYFPPASTNVGVYGLAPTGRGGAFSGSAAQVRLMPSSKSGHPASGEVGDLFLDSNTRLWFCKGGSTWVLLA